MTEKEDYLKLLPDGLTKTGFLLEHEVTEAFSRAGWSVINNRFYVDDVDGKARELDLVIYKVHSNKSIDVVTCLLISCKKDEQNAFVFMSREKSKLDPNIDWQPVHYWTAQEPLCTFLQSSSWKDDYINGDAGLRSQIFEIKRHAFATQLASRSAGKPQNDRPIFDSIAGLMKALDHEMLSLPSRMKKQRIYIFNLITVVDAPIVDAQCSGAKIVPKEVNDFKYLSRYIVRKREITARIHFIAKPQLGSLVNMYSSLAERDKIYFESAVTLSYKAITNNDAVRDYFVKGMNPILSRHIDRALKIGDYSNLLGDVQFQYDGKTKELVIVLNVFEDEAIDYLAKDSKLTAIIKRLLKEFARYEGPFRFQMDVPF